MSFLRRKKNVPAPLEVPLTAIDMTIEPSPQVLTSLEVPVEPVVVTIESPPELGYNSLTVLQEKFVQLKQDHERVLHDLANAKHAIQSHRNVIRQMREETYDGRFIWCLKPIDELFTEPPEYAMMPNEKYPGVRLHSQPFYTSCYGYKMNLGCHIDTRMNQMITYLVVANGPFDI